MKFRPKLSKTLDPAVLELRLLGGHENYNYKRNVNELKIYEEKHKKKFQQLVMRSHKKSKVFWIEETAEQEARSVQLWNKKERFLRRKKHEESQQTLHLPSEPTSYFSSLSGQESYLWIHWEIPA